MGAGEGRQWQSSVLGTCLARVDGSRLSPEVIAGARGTVCDRPLTVGFRPMILRVELNLCRRLPAAPRVENQRSDRILIEIERPGEIVRLLVAQGERREAKSLFDELQDR